MRVGLCAGQVTTAARVVSETFPKSRAKFKNYSVEHFRRVVRGSKIGRWNLLEHSPKSRAMFKKSKLQKLVVVGGIVLPLIAAYFRRNPRFCDISGTRKDIDKRATGSCSAPLKTPGAFLTLQKVDIWVFGCCFDICKIVRIRKNF